MNANDRLVKGPDGVYGTVDITCWPSGEDPDCDIDLRLADGHHRTLASDLLIEQNDGSYYLPLHQPELAAFPMRDKPAPGTDDGWPCDHRPEEEVAPAQH